MEYREAVTDLFNNFVITMRGRGGPLREQATPREVERIIAQHSDITDEISVDNLVGVFEEADYSLHDITRRDFVKAYRAVEALTPDSVLYREVPEGADTELATEASDE